MLTAGPRGRHSLHVRAVMVSVKVASFPVSRVFKDAIDKASAVQVQVKGRQDRRFPRVGFQGLHGFACGAMDDQSVAEDSAGLALQRMGVLCCCAAI